LHISVLLLHILTFSRSFTFL